MRLKEGFITHESMGEHIMVTAGNATFNGMVRSNRTAGFIIECLKKVTSKEEIIQKMLANFDASREQIEKDVEQILERLHNIGAIDD